MNRVMNFKPKNMLGKIWLKATNRRAYLQYKGELKEWHELNRFKESEDKIRAAKDRSPILTVEKIKQVAQLEGRINCVHSGNAGDIIYALPTLRDLKKVTNVPVHLFLKLNEPSLLPSHFNHPLGKVRLNNEVADMLRPLLLAQPYVESCEIFRDQKIDIRLDQFRDFPLYQGDIARWPSYTIGLRPDLTESWLRSKPNSDFEESIVVARSARYNNLFADYSFLNDFSNLIFVGVSSEYEAMRKFLPRIEWLKLNNFQELGECLSGCKFFIGNQSFPYSVAEGLKIPRVLEQSFDVSNVVPSGKNAYEFYFQEHFEATVHGLNSKQTSKK